MKEEYVLKVNTEARQYEFHIEGYLAKIEYMMSKNGEIYLMHTEMPAALEGRGIGSLLVGKALEEIEKKGLRMVPLCSFVTEYIRKHPEWKRILMKGIHI